MLLNLHIADPLVVDYLNGFTPQEREQKALEALRVGTIALRAVTPALDISLVEQKFNRLQSALADYANQFGRGLEEQMNQHFKAETGTVPRQLEEYFGAEHGRLLQIVRDQIGPESAFGKVLDPENSLGLLQRIETAVSAKLQETSNKLLQQFSLDQDESALTRLQRLMEAELESVKTENAVFFAQLREHLGMQKGREEEAARGTQKGRDFESTVYDRIAQICRSTGDISENVSCIPGNIARCKTGDYTATLGHDSGAPGKRIVIEAKNKERYTLKDAIEELKQAKENRGASVGIIVFPADCCPAEIGNFRIVEDDILIAVDADNLAGDPYLESAYRIGRAMVIAKKNPEFTNKVNVQHIATLILRIERTCDRFSEIHKKASSIKHNALAVEELADEIRPEIEANLREIEMLLRLRTADKNLFELEIQTD